VQPRPNWFDRAACKGEDPAWWHPDGTDNQTRAAKAVAICRRCPVRQDCLEHALANDEWLGVWGGTQPSERHRIAARRRQA
jgi:WhiB family redox-sensing transcriptional regulator